MAVAINSSTQPIFNILLLGETGVGKSTFINAFINYLVFDTMEEAAAEKNLAYKIPTKFTVTDENFQQRIIEIGNSTNEVQEDGASATQNPKCYLLNTGDATIRLIDTPGVGDTRGADQDNINFEKLLSFIAKYDQLHAICILLKPNEARITVMFDYCIKQLLSRLEKSASQNMVFLFTNSRGTFYRPGDTFTSLKAIVEETKSRPPYVTIPLNKNNVFCIDNEAFRFLLTLRHGIEFTELEKQNFITSWKQSANECARMLIYVSGLKPHKVQDTISVNEARRLIVKLSQPLSDISDLIQLNIDMLQDKEAEVSLYENDVEQLKKKLYVPSMNLKIEELAHPRTVCTASKCHTAYKINGKEVYHYQKACCDPCTLSQTPSGIVGAHELILCESMLSESGMLPEVVFNGLKNLFKSAIKQTDSIICTRCGCSHKLHKHIYYQSSPYEDNIVDENIKSQLKNKENVKATVEGVIRDVKKRRADYEYEQETINKLTAKFAHFLQQNAITPYNDAYEHFIQYTIENENSKGAKCDRKKIKHYEEMLRSYKKEKETLDKALAKAQLSDANATSCVTAADVMTCIKELYALKYCGSKIAEMFAKQTSALNSEAATEGEVPVHTEKKSSTFKRLLGSFF